MGESEKIEYQFKVLVVGDIAVGKTSLVARYVHRKFDECYKATICVDFASRSLRWSDGITVNVRLWDIAGQERTQSLTRAYYNGATGAIIVFDLTNDDTLESVKRWKQEMDQKVMSHEGCPVPCILIGNKCDFPRRPGRTGDPLFMEAYCRENNFVAWFECSAKENINIDEAVNCLIEKMLNDATLDDGVIEAKYLDLNEERSRGNCAC